MIVSQVACELDAARGFLTLPYANDAAPSGLDAYRRSTYDDSHAIHGWVKGLSTQELMVYSLYADYAQKTQGDRLSRRIYPVEYRIASAFRDAIEERNITIGNALVDYVCNNAISPAGAVDESLMALCNRLEVSSPDILNFIALYRAVILNVPVTHTVIPSDNREDGAFYVPVASIKDPLRMISNSVIGKLKTIDNTKWRTLNLTPAWRLVGLMLNNNSDGLSSDPGQCWYDRMGLFVAAGAMAAPVIYDRSRTSVLNYFAMSYMDTCTQRKGVYYQTFPLPKAGCIDRDMAASVLLTWYPSVNDDRPNDLDRDGYLVMSALSDASPTPMTGDKSYAKLASHYVNPYNLTAKGATEAIAAMELDEGDEETVIMDDGDMEADLSLDESIDAEDDNDEPVIAEAAADTAELEDDNNNDMTSDAENADGSAEMTAVQDFVYRRSVLRMCDDLENTRDVNQTNLESLKAWCDHWLWLCSIDDVKATVNRLGLTDYLNDIN
jgi:hypothetical protein